MNYKHTVDMARQVVNAGKPLIFDGRELSIIDAVLMLKDERHSSFERMKLCQKGIQELLKKFNADLFNEVDMTGQDISTIIHQFANNPNKSITIKPAVRTGIKLNE